MRVVRSNFLQRIAYFVGSRRLAAGVQEGSKLQNTPKQ